MDHDNEEELLARRANSFGASATTYAEHRPDYPSAAIRWALGTSRPLRVLDLAAGTGKLTGGIKAAGHQVVAVEPDEQMRAELVATFPHTEALAGTAEDIPLDDGAVDAVLVGQAFHWFNADRALPEIARVLRGAGVLAGLWNYRDDRVAWVAELERVSHGSTSWSQRHRGRHIPEHRLFGQEWEATFPHAQRRTVESLLLTASTHSNLLVLDERARERAFAEIERFLRGCPDIGDGEFDLPLRTSVARTTLLD